MIFSIKYFSKKTIKQANLYKTVTKNIPFDIIFKSFIIKDLNNRINKCKFRKQLLTNLQV